MSLIKQFREPKLSIWQSAVDEVLAKKLAGKPLTAAPGATGMVSPSGPRPNLTHPVIQESASYCAAQSVGTPLSTPAPGPQADRGILNAAGYCSMTAMKLAEATLSGNEQDCQRYRDELGKFTDCDPLYLEAAAKYTEYFLAQ